MRLKFSATFYTTALQHFTEQLELSGQFNFLFIRKIQLFFTAQYNIVQIALMYICNDNYRKFLWFFLNFVKFCQ